MDQALNVRVWGTDVLGWSPSLSYHSLWWKMLEKRCCEQALEREGRSVYIRPTGGSTEAWDLPRAWVLAAGPMSLGHHMSLSILTLPSQGQVMERD